MLLVCELLSRTNFGVSVKQVLKEHVHRDGGVLSVRLPKLADMYVNDYFKELFSDNRKYRLVLMESRTLVVTCATDSQDLNSGSFFRVVRNLIRLFARFEETDTTGGGRIDGILQHEGEVSHLTIAEGAVDQIRVGAELIAQVL